MHEVDTVELKERAVGVVKGYIGYRFAFCSNATADAGRWCGPLSRQSAKCRGGHAACTLTGSRARSRAARPERLEEEYYPRDQYHRYPREYPRDRDYHDGYSHDYRADEAYGHDYTREYARDYARESYPREERSARPRERDPPEDYGPSRRALNAL
ncbi:unnamed protein product [Pieris macdunnoughi]|uniref:Uncharacterized protein n=1 Tax=Pieris macdunnoughi TaxID=345717 RepID=A0A821Y2Q9_9NEOP|nr:unnamed protein product [Pieris macdunnoughi]